MPTKNKQPRSDDEILVEELARIQRAIGLSDIDMGTLVGVAHQTIFRIRATGQLTSREPVLRRLRAFVMLNAQARSRGDLRVVPVFDELERYEHAHSATTRRA